MQKKFSDLNFFRTQHFYVMTSHIVPNDWLCEKAKDWRTLDRFEERDRLSKFIALLSEKKIRTIVGNENLFATLYDACALSDALNRGAHATVYTNSHFQLLYLYHLQRLWQQKLIVGPSEAAVAFRKKVSDVPRRDIAIQDEDLQYFFSRLTCTRKDYFSNSDVDVCLDIIIEAIYDQIVWNVKADDESQLTPDQNQQIQTKFREIEGKFDLAFFFITAFANIPPPEASLPKEDYFVKAREKYADLIQRCKNDVIELEQSNAGNFSYAAIWNAISTTSNVDYKEIVSKMALKILSVGFKLYNLYYSFIFFHNRWQLPNGHQGCGSDGLIATFLRLNALELCCDDLRDTMAKRVQNVFSLLRDKPESMLLGRIGQIFAAGSAIMQWNELTDALSGRKGEGAARLVCALESGLPSVNIDPSFFFELDTCISTEAEWSFLDDNAPPSHGFTAIGNPFKFRLQAKLVFAPYVAEIAVFPEDAKSPTTVMELIYGPDNNAFVDVLQCVYYKGFAQPTQVFLQAQLDAILVDNRVNSATISELAEKYKQKTAGELVGRFETFGIDWNSVKIFAVDDMMRKMTQKIRQELVETMDALILKINDARERENEQAQTDAANDYEKRLSRTAVNYKDSQSNAAKVATIYSDGTYKDLDPASSGNHPTLPSAQPFHPTQPSQSSQLAEPSQISQMPQPSQFSQLPDTQKDTQQDTQTDKDEDVDDKKIKKEAEEKKKADANAKTIALEKMRKQLVEKERKDNFEQPKRGRKPSLKPELSKRDVPAATNRIAKRPLDSQIREYISAQQQAPRKIPHEKDSYTYRIGTFDKAGKNTVLEGTFFCYYPLVAHIGIGTPDVPQPGIQWTVKDIQEDRDKAGFNVLYPVQNPELVIALQKSNNGAKYFLNYWTMPYENLPVSFHDYYTKEKFDERRRKFCETWIQHIWSLNDKEYIVHLGNERLEAPYESEFARLVLGAGFLIFDQSFLDEILDKIPQLMQNDSKYPWSTGEEVLQALKDAENFQPKSLLEPWIVMDAKITTVTIKKWAEKQHKKLQQEEKLAKKAKIAPVNLPQPKKGTTISSLREERLGQKKPRMVAASSSSSDDNNADEDNVDEDDYNGDYNDDNNDNDDDDGDYGRAKKSKVSKVKQEQSAKGKKEPDDADWALSIFAIAEFKTEVRDKRGRIHYERIVRRHGRDKNNENIRVKFFSLDEDDFQMLVAKYGTNNKAFRNHLILPGDFNINDAIAITADDVEAALRIE